jgi:DNA-binding NarL/FixJ family response regulator
MANRLDLADGTVRAYRKNLYRKLNASTRASAIAAARNLALLAGSDRQADWSRESEFIK